ncbi:MAG: hypothetical protein BA863_01395 [Desulfovibrio sp. S3730MH75]|nr:MAG: hypothetical protein BA863_01395 [Desulfovibrio sp. S3730MH75]
MERWNANNSAYRTTWITLVHLNQLAKSFKDSKDVKMKDLTFWGHADSDSMRKQILEGLSIQIDNYFTKLCGVRYEEDSSREKALKEMQEILKEASKTVENFAQACDDQYKFWREGELNV